MSENRETLYPMTPGNSPLLQTLARLIAAHPAERIRVLPDASLAGAPGADFLLQIDDYDLRLILLDAPGGRPSLDLRQVQSAVRVLEDNPGTLAVLLVWSVENLPAVPLSLTRIRYLAQNSDKIPDLLRQARPLEDVASEIIRRQTRPWSAGLTEIPPSAGQGFDLYQIFSGEIGQAIDAEMHRKYVHEERRQAAREFPYQPEKQFILSVLQDALRGIETGQLVERLVQVRKRSQP